MVFAFFGNLGICELSILLIVPLTFAFWVWMLVDCLQNEPSEGNEKLIWVLVIVLLYAVGALIYYFVRRSNRQF